ncbi:MAG TPA: cyclopropane-fatty-acyl-phospholipid synthase family protein [Rhodoblastus sp.]|nr:cyclopropane-fatty-acyl-phospholipid synthase family protein [Rhodoblastus sp.]
MLGTQLDKRIRTGRLAVTWPDGRTTIHGSPEGAPPDVAVRLSGRLTPLRLALHPDLFLGEAFMNRSLVIERGTLWDLLDLLGRNFAIHEDGPLQRAIRPLMNWATQRNSRARAQRNVAHHYDLSAELYRLFLDEDMQYSCAYFPRPGMSLDAAQAAKKQHIVGKLRLRPGQRVLDIGCGWGGLALEIAKAEEVDVLGVTLSREQLAIARERAREAGLADRVRFELKDFRDLDGRFDRIVSVGMFEHVGLPNYPAFFAGLRDLLASPGLAVLHSIGRMHGPSTTSQWTRKYIFPGGYIPAVSEVMPHVENAGLWLCDVEILRLHYAQTLRLWRERFLERRADARTLYDERFVRMWEYYLAVSELGFRYGGLMVFQLQLATDIDLVPLTRDYIAEHDRESIDPSGRVSTSAWRKKTA